MRNYYHLRLKWRFGSQVPSIQRVSIIPHSSRPSKPDYKKMDEEWKNIQSTEAMVDQTKNNMNIAKFMCKM
jgi:hypothetical protein